MPAWLYGMNTVNSPDENLLGGAFGLIPRVAWLAEPPDSIAMG
jgi:hypothetical protein